MKIEEIYKTISEYDITPDNMLDFIFQGKQGDLSHYYYRCMLLQLLENAQHFDYIIELYYRLEQGSIKNGSYNVIENGMKKGITYKEALDEGYVKKAEVYDDFKDGNGEKLRKIIDWANLMLSELEGIKRPDSRLKILDYSLARKEDETTDLDNLSPEDGTIEKVKQVFLSLGLRNVWNECLSRYKYYNKEQSVKNILFWEDTALYDLKKDFSNFKKDLYFCSKVIQNQPNVLSRIMSGAPFEEVCEVIRTGMHYYNPELEIGIREKGIYGGGDEFITDYAPSGRKVSAAYKKLAKEFSDVIEEQDENQFIRLCANFHFDFLRVHPFLDGNGRTARVLLSSMLASRDIFFPAVYSNITEKEDFYRRSDAAIRGNYTITQEDVLKKIQGYLEIFPKSTIDENGQEWDGQNFC